MKQKRTILIIAVLTTMLFSGCAGESLNTFPQEPIYNNAHIVSSHNSETEDTATIASESVAEETPVKEEPAAVSSESVVDKTLEKEESTAIISESVADETLKKEESSAAISEYVTEATHEKNELSPATDIKMIKQGNRFEETVSFGHFCYVGNGFYFVDLNDGFLYFMNQNGNRTTVLKDYVRALNYYDGFLYYIKGTKKDFLAMEYFYAGNIWRLDTTSGKETCLIDSPENLSLAVNEYGIFCNPNGGGIALYDFEGKEIKRISDENQGVDIMGNKIRLNKSGKPVLYDLDTGEESNLPYYQLYCAYIGDRAVCADMDAQETKIVLNLSDGGMNSLPECEAFAFAVCGNELYAADATNLYRINFEKMEYENIISYPPYDSPIYFYELHSDGSRLYAVIFNRENFSKLVEVDTNSGELKYLESE